MRKFGDVVCAVLVFVYICAGLSSEYFVVVKKQKVPRALRRNSFGFRRAPHFEDVSPSYKSSTYSHSITGTPCLNSSSKRRAADFPCAFRRILQT